MSMQLCDVRGVRTAAMVAVAAFVPAVSAMGSIVIDSRDPSDPFDDQILDVRESIGLGMHASYLVVDFAQTGGETYAWEWRWNPGDDARSATMLAAIAAETDLFIDLQGEDGVGFGVFAANFELASEGEFGAAEDFWSFWTAEPEDIDPGVSWLSSPVGASFRDLSNGSIDGFLNGFRVGEPGLPLVTIPAPAGLAMFGGLLMARRRRR